MCTISLCLNPARDIILEVKDINIGNPNKAISNNSFAGGKGINVARTMKNCNHNCIIMGFAGGYTGNYIINELNKEKISNDFVITKNETRTNFKILSNKDKYTEFNLSGSPVSKKEQDLLFEKLVEKVRSLNKMEDFPKSINHRRQQK